MVYALLILGLAFLIFGGNAMVSGSVALARRLGLSPLLIGLTLVGFGTSTPELLTSLLAVFKNSPGIAVGNVVGSNTANILLILGVAALIRPISIDLKSFKRDGSFLAFSTIALIVAIWIGTINWMIGTLMVGTLIYYIYYSYQTDKKQQKLKSQIEHEVTNDKPQPIWLALIMAVGGIALTMLGAKLLVDNSIILARNWGISEAIIGLTVVAVGTSLPELSASVISSVKKHGDLAFGNVVGSNIYNALFILGVTALLLPVAVPADMGKDVAIMAVTTAVLIGLAFWKKQISRLAGVLFLVAYVIYISYLYQGAL